MVAGAAGTSFEYSEFRGSALATSYSGKIGYVSSCERSGERNGRGGGGRQTIKMASKCAQKNKP